MALDIPRYFDKPDEEKRIGQRLHIWNAKRQAIQQQVTIEQAYRAVSLSRQYPLNPPGIIEAFVKSEAPEEITDKVSIAVAEMEMNKRRSEELGIPDYSALPLYEQQRQLLMEKVDQAGASNMGLTPGVENVAEAVSSGIEWVTTNAGIIPNQSLKDTTRNVLAVAESGVQEASRLTQAAMTSNRGVGFAQAYRDTAPSWIAGAIESGKPVDARGNLQGIGDGIMPAGDVAQLQAERAYKFAAEHYPEIERAYREDPNKVFFSPGRGLAGEFFDPNTIPYNIGSAIGDFIFNIVGDPVSIAAGGGIKAAQARKVIAGNRGIRAAFPTMERMGLFGGPRKVVMQKRVMEALDTNPRGAELLNWTANETSVDKIKNMWNSDVHTAATLASLNKPEAVRSAIENAMYMGRITHAPGPYGVTGPTQRFLGHLIMSDETRLGGLKLGLNTYTKNAFRFAGRMPGESVNAYNVDEGYEDLSRLIDTGNRNALLTSSTKLDKDKYLNAFAMASDPVRRRQVVHSYLDELAGKIADETSLDRSEVRNLFPHLKQQDDVGEYAINMLTGRPLSFPGAARNEMGEAMATASFIAEQSALIAIPDAREIRRAISWYAAVNKALPVDSPDWLKLTGQKGRDLAHKIMVGTFIPVQLIGRSGAWLSRVVLDESARIAADGAASLIRPVDYLMYMIGGTGRDTWMKGVLNKALPGTDLVGKIQSAARGATDISGDMLTQIEHFQRAMGAKTAGAGWGHRAGGEIFSRSVEEIAVGHEKFNDAWWVKLKQLRDSPVVRRLAAGLSEDDINSLPPAPRTKVKAYKQLQEQKQQLLDLEDSLNTMEDELVAPPGYTRLFRIQEPGQDGAWYGSSLEEVSVAYNIGATDRIVKYVDVPDSQVGRYMARNQPSEISNQSLNPDNEFFLPRELTANSQQLDFDWDTVKFAREETGRGPRLTQEEEAELVYEAEGQIVDQDDWVHFSDVQDELNSLGIKFVMSDALPEGMYAEARSLPDGTKEIVFSTTHLERADGYLPPTILKHEIAHINTNTLHGANNVNGHGQEFRDEFIKLLSATDPDMADELAMNYANAGLVVGEPTVTKVQREIGKLESSRDSMRNKARANPTSFETIRDWYLHGSGKQYREQIAINRGSEKLSRTDQQRFGKQENFDNWENMTFMDSMLDNEQFAERFLYEHDFEQLKQLTANDPELMEFVATGKIRKYNQRTKQWDEIDLESHDLNSYQKSAAKKWMDKKLDSLIQNQNVQTPITLLTSKSVIDPEGVAKLQKSFINTLFDVLFTKWENLLTRAPLFRAEYWDAVEKMIPYAGPKVRAEILANLEKANFPTSESLGGRVIPWNTRTSHIKKIIAVNDPGQLDDVEQFKLLVAGMANERVKKLLYDVADKTNISDMVRLWIPFMEAYLEIGKVWGNIFMKNPTAPYKLYRGYENARNSGAFVRDPQTDQEMFVLPGSQKGLALATQGIKTPDNARLRLGGFVSGLNTIAQTITPGFGPLAVRMASNLLDPSNPNTREVRELISPFGEPGVVDFKGTPIPGDFVPAWAKRALDADNMGGKDWAHLDTLSESINAQMNDTTKWLLATGAYSDPGTGLVNKQNMDRLLTDAYEITRKTFAVRAWGDAFLPTTTRPMYEVKIGDKEGAKWYLLAQLGEEYAGMIEDQGGDRSAAWDQFVKKFGIASTAALMAESRAQTVRSFTKAGWQWEAENPQLHDDLQLTLGYFAPDPGGDFDPVAFFNQFENKGGTREQLTADEMVLLRNNALGYQHLETVRQEANEQFGMEDSEEKDEFLKFVEEDIKKQYPGFNSFIPGIPATPTLKHKLEELDRAVKINDPALTSQPAHKGLVKYWEVRTFAHQQVINRGKAKTWQQPKDAAEERQFLRFVGEEISREFKEFRPLFKAVLEPEINQYFSPEQDAAILGGN